MTSDNVQFLKENEMYRRLDYFWIALIVAVVFLTGLAFLGKGREQRLDLSSHYYNELPMEDRIESSFYNWRETKSIEFELNSPIAGMVNLRASNGEILFQTYLEAGIVEELSLDLPSDVDMVLIEYRHQIESVNIDADHIALSY